MSERTSTTIRGRDESPGPDASTTRGQIDAFYDKAETFVSGIGRIVGVDTSAPITPPAPVAPAARMLPAASPGRFEIVEVAAFAVTNGRQTSAPMTRDQAEAVLAKLREAGQ